MTFLINKQSNDSAVRVHHSEDSSDIFKTGFGFKRDLTNLHRVISDAIDANQEIMVNFEDDEPNIDSETLSAEECFDSYQFYVEYVRSHIRDVHDNVSIESIEWSYPLWLFEMREQELSDSSDDDDKDCG